MTGRTTGWIATGIHPNPSMIGGDIMWCQGTGPNTGVVVWQRICSTFSLFRSYFWLQIERFATAQARPPPVSPQEIV
jgi:hypothetical protein